MEIIIKAAVLGLSTGIYCAGFCLPVMMPIIMMREQSTAIQRSFAVLKFSLGRLVAYLLIGGLFGYLGQKMHSAIIPPITAGSFIVLSLLLIGYGLINGFPHFKICTLIKKALPETRFTVLTGFFIGLHICPPFLLAIGYVFQLGQIVNGMLFFFIFFLTTSFYLVPFILIGYFAKVPAMRWVAQFSTILAGCLFFWIGISHFIML
ncbi:sulfite exporter TauE/SafE family protein [candidate division KSB1 bacterium]|nr:sulfite exporter TauE/SafE family protein [candidate division KSB1 bacterium]